MREGARVTLARAGLAGLLLAGAVASVAGPGAQLGFAVAAIGMVGMAHGAGDLAAVRHGRRSGFLAAYAAVAAVTLALWGAAPAAAMTVFLLASAAHFAVEDGSADTPFATAGRGLLMIGGPALLHRTALAALLAPVTDDAATLDARALWAAGLVGIALALPDAWRRRDARLALGAVALVLPPPLVGFALGFLLLHALPQTRARAAALGCADVSAYLRRVAPVFALALAGLGAVAAAFLPRDGSGLTGCFAALAALATPHLLVTPWFERRRAAGDTSVAHCRSAAGSWFETPA